jgi:hypothetical protein
MTMPELTIPKSKSDVVFTFGLTLFAWAASAFAVWSLLQGFNEPGEIVSFLASISWLSFFTMGLRAEIQRQGSFKKLALRAFGHWFGRLFVRATASGNPPSIQFGFQLLGRTLIERTIPTADIETVEWSSGQATSLAGRDMDDWSIVLWYDHHNPEKPGEHLWRQKPRQDLEIVGPSRAKSVTQEFGLQFVKFLRASGANLLDTDNPDRFQRGDAGA